jgi:hypothetical protein
MIYPDANTPMGPTSICITIHWLTRRARTLAHVLGNIPLIPFPSEFKKTTIFHTLKARPR